MRKHLPIRCLSAAVALGLTAQAFAAATVRMAAIEVTSSKVAQPVERASSRVTVIGGDELRQRGATDLRSALARVAGVEISQGGDGGPASSVPAFWGLREFDAFLLVVDGVPWGGAFTPALASLDLANIERIEVLRGAAPVSYGATAFVGVIQVVHYAAGEGPTEISFGIGSRGSYQAALALPFAPVGDVKQSLLLDAEQQDLSTDRSGYDRAHALYRVAMPLAAGDFGLDLDLSFLRQDPTSPSPRAGSVLSPLVPIHSNQNPSDARMDEDRAHLVARFSQDSSWGEFNVVAAASHSNQNLVRGFLVEEFDVPSGENAAGYRQDRGTDAFYLDLHWDRQLSDRSRVIYGADWLAGQGDQTSRNFDYRIPLDGSNAPSSRANEVQEITQTDDERQFLGVYADWQFQASEDWQIDAGIRLNHTHEQRDTGMREPDGGEVEADGDSRTVNRLSGAMGTSYRLWAQDSDSTTLYANYKNTFKPAVIDFGPEAEGGILEPEYASSGEIGLRGSLSDHRLQWDVSAFYMDFRNIVVPQIVNNLPGLANAGTLHLKGAELEADFAVTEQLRLLGRFAYHNASFGDYVRLFSAPTQLLGRHQEMSPQHLSALGLDWAPLDGLNLTVTGNYVGDRFYNQRNTAVAPSYATWDAGVSYSAGAWTWRVDGSNLSDRRDAISESELGEGAYYRMPARTYWASASYRFQ